MEEAPPAAASAATAAGAEVSTNQTIYINNLNEKIKLDGTFHFCWMCCFWRVCVLCLVNWYLVVVNSCADRIEEIAARGVFAVRQNTGGFGVQNPKAQGASMGCVWGGVFRHQCASPNARISVLRQAYGMNLCILLVFCPLWLRFGDLHNL